MPKVNFCQSCGKAASSAVESCPSCGEIMPTRGGLPSGAKESDSSLPLVNAGEKFNFCPGCGIKSTDPNTPCRMCGFLFDSEKIETDTSFLKTGKKDVAPTQIQNFCPSCGAKTATGNRFCAGCGKEVLTLEDKAQLTEMENGLESVPNPTKPSNAYAWLMVFSPLVYWIIELAMGVNANALVTFVVPFALNTWFVLADAKLLEASGYKVNRLLGFILVPIYLFIRSKSLKQPQLLFIIWLLVFGATIVGSSAGLQSMDTSPIEASISEKLNGADVTCPEQFLSIPGTSFTCLAEDETGSAIVEVKVQDAAGHVIWQVQ